MDHVVYLDEKTKEFDKIQRGVKTYLIRAGAGKMLPYQKVEQGDLLYFIKNNGEGALKGKAIVKAVYNSPKMTVDQAEDFLEPFKERLRLSATQEKRIIGKRFMVIVEIENFEKIRSIEIDKSNYDEKADWIVVGDIQNIKLL